jgi:hypothetical protein
LRSAVLAFSVLGLQECITMLNFIYINASDENEKMKIYGKNFTHLLVRGTNVLQIG